MGSTSFRSILTFASCVVGTCNILLIVYMGFARAQDLSELDLLPCTSSAEDRRGRSKMLTRTHTQKRVGQEKIIQGTLSS